MPTVFGQKESEVNSLSVAGASSVVSRTAPVVKVTRVDVSATVTTIAAGFQQGDVLEFYKGSTSGSWTIDSAGSGFSFAYPNGSVDNSMILPAGTSFGVRICARASAIFDVTVLG